MPKVKKAEITLNYQNYIAELPVMPAQLHQQSCMNDNTTVDAWLDNWIENVQENHKDHGPFKSKSIGRFYDENRHRPIIVAGSGPSLKRNGHELKNKKDIKIISCLHNFHFMVDNDIEVDYYVTLDHQDLTYEEVYEGGKEEPEHYWEKTKGKVLFAFIGACPKLLKAWRGEIFFFNCPVPSEKYYQETQKLEVFNIMVSCGGNVLGACAYIAKAILGSNPLVFVGADFCFSYDKKFHGWNSKYDKSIGRCISQIDIFGNKVMTWQSYANFKAWFEWLAIKIPGLYINCSEGGTLGSYPQGNIMQITQLDLEEFFIMYNGHELVKEQMQNPAIAQGQPLF